jgi:hypothetical protein
MGQKCHAFLTHWAIFKWGIAWVSRSMRESWQPWTRGLMMNVSFSSWPQQQWVTQSPLSVSTAVSGTEESYANAGRWHWPLWELWYCMALDPSRRLVSSKERLMSPYLHTTASN